MRFARTLLALLAPLSLAGCYITQTPLITGDKAAFPYQKIVYTESSDNKPITLVHEGDAYTTKNEKGEVATIRFLPVEGEDSLYVAQLGSKTEQGEVYLYGLVRLDAAAKQAKAYAVFAEKSDIDAGMPACQDNSGMVCLTDLQAYIDYAKKQAGPDAKPASIYNISELD
jgi:hypothetical protein